MRLRSLVVKTDHSLMRRKIKRPLRSEPLWYAFVLHRVSGVMLALFLPVHFYVLALALTQPDRFEKFITWVDNPMAKLAETILIFLLASHLLGGLRLLALEFLPWPSYQKTFAACVLVFSLALSLLFLLNAL